MTKQSPLPKLWEVPQEFRNRLGKQAGRQRAMFFEGHLLLVLHRPPQPDDPIREGRYFWRQADGSWLSSNSGNGPQALQQHLNEYAELLQKYDHRAETAGGTEDNFAVLNALAPVHRSARHMHETLREARKMVPEDRDLLHARDRAYEIERTAELLYGEVRNALDLAFARRTEEQAHTSRRMSVSAHRLNLLAAFFFPIATLSAIFGVNLTSGLEHVAAPIPFFLLVGAGLAFGLMLQSFLTPDVHEPVSVKDRLDQRRPPDRHSPRREP